MLSRNAAPPAKIHGRLFFLEHGRSTDPELARKFARVTFLSDNRADLERCHTPALILQCTDDVIAPTVVGEYVHANLADSTFVAMNATGHCPNLSAPDETVAAIKDYLSSGGR